MKSTDKLFDFASLSPEELRKLQLRLLGVLEALDAFCKEHNLRYYLAGGTCIGAVRHHGFIPWDDDLDVSMPREDYEKLYKLWNNTGRYRVERAGENVVTGAHIIQIRDSKTTCIYDYARDYDICQGVKIDVSPIDGAPEGNLARKIQKLYCNIFGLMCAQRVPRRGSSLRKKLAKIILIVIRSKRLRYHIFNFSEKQIKRYDYDHSKTVLVGYSYYFDKTIYGEPEMKEFEGRLFPIPHDWHNYLKREYGDYMQYPPEDERKPVSKVFFYDPDESCYAYKGKKYCVRESTDKS